MNKIVEYSGWVVIVKLVLLIIESHIYKSAILELFMGTLLAGIATFFWFRN